MYNLNNKTKTNTLRSLREIAELIKDKRGKLALGMFFVFVNSAVTILTPYILGFATDELILKGFGQDLLAISVLLVLTYFISSLANYFQIVLIGSIGIETLYKLRNRLFSKLNDLPISFFNTNKSGDLISRINNDTDVLNGLFSEVLVRFFGSFFTVAGIGIFLIFLNTKLAILSLGPILTLVIYTILTSSIYRRINRNSQDSVGDLSAEIAENLNNYRVLVAFDKRDFFRDRIYEAIDQNFKKLTLASFVNSIATPIYDFVGNMAVILVIVLGLSMVKNEEITIGVLISFVLLVNRFYEPLRIIASLVGSIQRSATSWERINEILKLESNLSVINNPEKIQLDEKVLIKLIDVDFGYGESLVLKDVNLEIQKGKTYALVGPTGGGKSTLASLIMRLYDPVVGKIVYKGFDLRTYKPDQISSEIGFILQEPFLFHGTVEQNLKYGNEKLKNLTQKELLDEIERRNLTEVLQKFPEGLDTKTGATSTLSLGQRQLAAFMRAILRDPKLLIMDEATANVDTVTEQLLERILNSLPSETSKIIIAHRLNTIKKADEIYLIANGRVTKSKGLDEIISSFNSKSY